MFFLNYHFWNNLQWIIRMAIRMSRETNGGGMSLEMMKALEQCLDKLDTSSWPYIADDELLAMFQTAASGKINYWTGTECNLFEKEFAEFCGSEHGVSLTNGTDALNVALHALKIGKGDEVIVTPRTFIASASSITLCKAKPIFADVDPISQNITAETISKVISPRTKAIIVVHLAGWPCDMDPIIDLAKANNLKIIEDCAQAHGATYKGRMVGSLGDVAAFSFCNDKIISTLGEGGMLFTNDHETWRRAWSFKDHGRDYDQVKRQDHPFGFRWVCKSCGHNSRMTQVQAAVGRVQLRKLQVWLERRRKNAFMLTECFKTIPALRVTEPPEGTEHSYYKYDVFVRPEKLKPAWSRNMIAEAIEKEGVSCRQGSCPEVYLEEAFQDAGVFPPERLPVAKELGETSMQFLVHHMLGDEEMQNTCRAVKKVLAEASI